MFDMSAVVRRQLQADAVLQPAIEFRIYILEIDIIYSKILVGICIHETVWEGTGAQAIGKQTYLMRQ
jgi:hypothetical protein